MDREVLRLGAEVTEGEGGKSPLDGVVPKDQQPNLQSHDHIFFTEHFGTVYLADKLLSK